MVCRISAVIGVLGFLTASRSAAQDMPNPQAMQMQVQQIMQQRPPEAEVAGRAFLQLIMRDPGNGPVEPSLTELDSLKTRDPEAYWSEVAQLTVQSQMVQNLSRRDSVRAGLVIQLFGLEMRARSVQRAYRKATDAQRQELRQELEAQMTAHFEVENNLRQLEVADISRRLAQINAETQHRQERRAEFIKFAVDDIIRDAMRPR